MFVVLTVCLVLGHTGRFERSGSCVYRGREAGARLGRKKSRLLAAGGFGLGELLPKVGYGEYVIVRTPAMLAIVIVVPCEKPAGYDSFATELSALT